MRVGGLLGESVPTPADVAGREVEVREVWRAGSVIVAMLVNGAGALVPLAVVDEV